MRIEYEGTPLEGVLARSKILPIQFVYLNEGEFKEWLEEVERDHELKGCSRDNWFTVEGCEIVFYLEH